MKLSEFKISNYKCFYRPDNLEFTSGFNVIVGKNNVGKSTILEALTIKFKGKPHRSLLSLPKTTSPLSKTTNIEYSISMQGDELREICLANMTEIRIPFKEGSKVKMVLNDIFSMDEIKFRFCMKAEENEVLGFRPGAAPTHGLFSVEDNEHLNMALFVVNEDKTEASLQSSSMMAWSKEFGYAIARIFINRIYYFKAERLVFSEHAFGDNKTLSPDASNLPEVLNILQGNVHLFKKYNELLNIIFPTVYQVTTRPLPNNRLEILTWTENPVLGREDLAVPLSESGTGLGQVLAILYVALTSSYPRTVIIDEPNSFLHPGAAKKLIEILKDKFSIHQYIISTHSPEIMNVSSPTHIHFIRKDEHQSLIETLGSDDLASIKSVFRELGVKLNDIYGADYILWVEGETEERCFKLILDSIEDKSYDTVNILSLIKTGDFASKKIPANRFFEIYEKLSNGNALIPPAIGFEFDREGRSSKEIEILKQKANDRAFILPRRMYENYLIDVDAIVYVLQQLESLKGDEDIEVKVDNWFSENGLDKKYLNNSLKKYNLFDKEWLTDIDGAKVLHDLFQDISSAKEMYSKTIHSAQLTEWLLKNKSGVIQELKDFISKIISTSLH